MARWAKKLVRFAAASRAAIQGGSSNSRMVSGEGEEVQARQHHRRKTLAMAEIVVTKQNVAEIVACRRTRWKIENEGFNVMKNTSSSREGS